MVKDSLDESTMRGKLTQVAALAGSDTVDFKGVVIVARSS